MEVCLDVGKHAFFMLQAYGEKLKDNRQFGQIDSAKQRIHRSLPQAGYDV